MAHRIRDPDEEGWERSDMPIVCETCLGPNPFVRMQRIEFGGLCHISNRPYTVFRWRPGNDARYKKTIICQEVAKAKNVCQVCLLDLDFNLPVQVRDQALGISNEDVPESVVGKEFQLHKKDQDGELGIEYTEVKPNDLLLRLQRTTPYYKRNMAKVCTFFAKGQCNRGAECPYRHEMPTTGELANQNIKDRYYGVNDPVANKMLRRVAEAPRMEPPEDKAITTLFLGGVTPDITEEDIRDQFYAYGEVASVRKVDAKSCAFVTYTTRAGAEKAAAELHGKLLIKGQRVRLSWGRPQAPPGGAAPPGGPPPDQAPGYGYGAGPSGYGNTPQDVAQLYPSMAKDNLGTRIPRPGEGQKRGPDGEGGPDGDGAKRPRPLGYGAPPPYGGPPPGYGAPPPWAAPPAGPPPGGPAPPVQPSAT